MTKNAPVVANAYAVVSKEEEYDSVPVTAAVELDKPAPRSVSSEFQHIACARGLSWADDFFEDDDDIVAAFDFDYDAMEKYYSSVGWGCLTCTLFFPNIFTIAMMSLAPCFLNKNVRWNVRAQHIAVTRDGIRFVHDKRPCCWGYQCTDVGKRSKTIPFDKITDCDIVEPAGNTCCVIPNTLYTVNVDTASSNKEQHELRISGLKDPHAFKKLVWAMKRAYHPAAAGLPAALEMVGRGQDANEDVASLLRDIRDELRQNNQAPQALKPPAVAPSAPSEFL